jgi:hypothetical protein
MIVPDVRASGTFFCIDVNGIYFYQPIKHGKNTGILCFFMHLCAAGCGPPTKTYRKLSAGA